MSQSQKSICISPQYNKGQFLKNFKINFSKNNEDSNIFYQKFQKQLNKIIKQNKPTALIIGIPSKHQNNQTQIYDIAMKTLIEGFINKYQDQENIKAIENSQEINFTLIDQSWTTRESVAKLRDIQTIYSKWGHLHNQKKLLDGMAAMKILENYLKYYNSI